MSTTTMHDGRVVLHQADCLTAMAAMEENSIDAVVCDPPYHLTSIVKRFGKDGSAPAKEGTDGAFRRASGGFMGKVWDGGDIAFQPETWAAVLRVLKPGGYIVAFASTRGFGRMSVAMEDAGFITHPMLAWIFATGFPKATRIAAEGYDGFRYGGQALKPALEPIYMGQKPFSEKTGTANILRWGTGAVNIDGCRVPTDDDLNGGTYAASTLSDGHSGSMAGHLGNAIGKEFVQPLGRWPANICHDGSDEVISAFPDTKSGSRKAGEYGLMGYHGAEAAPMPAVDADSGSAARFFYCAKASRADRDAGMEDFDAVHRVNGNKWTDQDYRVARGERPQSAETGPRKNIHPTVKPTTLMQWLCRLVTPPGGVILDPFMGSGSTGKAAVLEGFRFVGCEREDEYMPIAQARIAWAIGAASQERRVAVKQRAAAPSNDNDLFSSAGAA